MANIKIFFHSFSDVTVNSNLIEVKDLNRNTIIKLLNISAIIKKLDVINKIISEFIFKFQILFGWFFIIKIFQIRTFLYYISGVYNL
jgi:hypothetical protein